MREFRVIAVKKLERQAVHLFTNSIALFGGIPEVSVVAGAAGAVIGASGAVIEVAACGVRVANQQYNKNLLTHGLIAVSAR